MRARLRKFATDAKGAAAVEFALSGGIILMLLIGIAQVGIIFMANAGLRHAVGEGARYSTIYPTPSDTAIIAKVNARRFGLSSAYITGPTVTHGTQNGASYTEVSMSYSVPIRFLFVSPTSVTLTETRRAFAS